MSRENQDNPGATRVGSEASREILPTAVSTYRLWHLLVELFAANVRVYQLQTSLSLSLSLSVSLSISIYLYLSLSLSRLPSPFLALSSLLSSLPSSLLSSSLSASPPRRAKRMIQRRGSTAITEEPWTWQISRWAIRSEEEKQEERSALRTCMFDA